MFVVIVSIITIDKYIQFHIRQLLFHNSLLFVSNIPNNAASKIFFITRIVLDMNFQINIYFALCNRIFNGTMISNYLKNYECLSIFLSPMNINVRPLNNVLFWLDFGSSFFLLLQCRFDSYISRRCFFSDHNHQMVFNAE